MNRTSKETQKACIVWLSGVRYADIRALPEMEILSQRGALLELEPSPITGPLAQHYQAWSGRLPSCFGFFDTLVPACHLAYSSRGIDGYSVVEEYAGREAAPKMLPDLLRAAGWTVEYVETSPASLAARLQRLGQAPASSSTCAIFKCVIEDAQAAFSDSSAIDYALQLASAWVGEDGLLAVFSDTQPARVERFVNVNNFLAEMGVLERDEQDGRIDWSNSLAYYAGHGQLWVNLSGRDPQGAVHPRDEYEEVRDTLVKALPAKLRNVETGRPMIERVYRKEEVYTGNYLFCAPDLVVQFHPGYAPSPRSARLDFDEAVSVEAAAGSTALAGAHPAAVKGFLLACGPALAPGIAVAESASLVAVAPTLLHALGIAPVGMDTAAVREMFSPVYLDTHPIRADMQEQELSEEDEELVINRLRDLGYI